MHRITKACAVYPEVMQVHLVGGVSANLRLRELTKTALPHIDVLTPDEIRLCTDNAAMIASAGYFIAQEDTARSFASFETLATIPLDEFIS